MRIPQIPSCALRAKIAPFSLARAAQEGPGTMTDQLPDAACTAAAHNWGGSERACSLDPTAPRIVLGSVPREQGSPVAPNRSESRKRE